MLTKPEPSSFAGEVCWHFDPVHGAVTAVCALCGMLGRFWSRPPRGTALQVDPDFVELHGRRCVGKIEILCGVVFGYLAGTGRI
jgi:hypothetical protein